MNEKQNKFERQRMAGLTEYEKWLVEKSRQDGEKNLILKFIFTPEKAWIKLIRTEAIRLDLLKKRASPKGTGETK